MSNLKDLENINQLYDQYGSLLTDKQQEYFELYYFEDLSLQEIADEHSVSRNAVHTNIKNSVSLLSNYEDKLQIIKKKHQLLDEIDKIESTHKIDLDKLKDLL